MTLVKLQYRHIQEDLETALYGATDGQFTVRVAASVEEACGLAEVGFEYVCDHNGTKIFRKRKY